MIEKELEKESLTSQLQGNKIPKRHDTCVILHILDPDMWNEFSLYLSNHGEKFDLIITIPYGVNISGEMIKASFPQAHVYRCENRGRDIAPFLAVFSAIAQLRFKYICKLHTKRSQSITSGSQWQEDTFGKLLGSQKMILQIKNAFEKHSEWGIIAPQGYVVPRDYFWRQNSTNVTRLAQSIGLQIDTKEFDFVAGSMFWFRPEALSQLLKLGLSTQDFEPEHGQIDGTLADALERFFGLSAAVAGFKIAESNSQTVALSAVGFQSRLLIQAFQQHELPLENEIATLQQSVTKRDEQITFLQKDLNLIADTLSEIQASRAWRLMAPLRWYGRQRQRVAQLLRALPVLLSRPGGAFAVFRNFV